MRFGRLIAAAVGVCFLVMTPLGAQESVDVIVIGAGVAGLTAARELSEEYEVIVLEASDRIGGRIHTLRTDPSNPIELGAEYIQISPEEAPRFWRMLNESGVRTRMLSFQNGEVYLEGRDGRQRISQLQSTHSWGRAISHLIRGQSDNIDGTEVLRRIDPLFSRYFDQPSVYQLIGGFDMFPRYLAEDLQIELNQVVKTVAVNSEGVEIYTQAGRRFRARAVISTLPIGVLKSGEVEFAPGLTEARQAALRQLETGPLTKYTIEFEEAFWEDHMPALFVARNNHPSITSYFTRRPASITAYFVGRLAVEVSNLSNAEIEDLIMHDLNQAISDTNGRTPRIRRTYRYDWSNHPYFRGAYSYTRSGEENMIPAHEVRRTLALPDDSAPIFFSGAGTSFEGAAETVHAACATAIRTANHIRRYLGQPRRLLLNER